MRLSKTSTGRGVRTNRPQGSGTLSGDRAERSSPSARTSQRACQPADCDRRCYPG